MKTKIGVLDFETDPFEPGREIQPFCWGLLWDDGTFFYDWSENCVASLAQHLSEAGDSIVFAHNGGRFDFLFLAEHLKPDALILDGRIMRCSIGECELRDSFMIMPHALTELGLKLFIDYKIFAKGIRDRHRKKIIAYLKKDCETLLEAVQAFRQNFGDSLTLSGASRKILQKCNKAATGRKIESLTLEHDRMFRKYYFGGRCENFEKGVIEDKWKIFDVRSMFSSVMRDEMHPCGADFLVSSELTDDTDFISFSGFSNGFLPVRKKSGGVEYPKASGMFHATGHEVRAGVLAGAVQINRVEIAYEFCRRENFAFFVNSIGQQRMQCLDSGDVRGAQQFKDILNSAYGGQGLAIDNLGDWRIEISAEKMPDSQIVEMKDKGYFLAYTCDEASFWQRPLDEPEKRRLVKNVALAASVTGAARVKLNLALEAADRPVYCDTDSIICRSLDLPLGDAIGQWRQIDQGTRLAIAGIKMYALFDDFGERCKASKGGDLSAVEIERIARGGVVKYRAKNPSYSVTNRGSYQERTFRAT